MTNVAPSLEVLGKDGETRGKVVKRGSSTSFKEGKTHHYNTNEHQVTGD